MISKTASLRQQRQRQIESSKAISQNIGSDLDSIMARLQMLAISEDICSKASYLIITQEYYWKKYTVK